MISNKQGNQETTMWLRKLGLARKSIATDETCLFRAVCDQIYLTQLGHESLRTRCIEHARTIQPDLSIKDFEQYLRKLKNHNIVCGRREMYILSTLLKRDFIIYNSYRFTKEIVTDHGYDKKIYLCLARNEHYDSVLPASYVDASCVCQSIVYEVLYEKVFGVENAVEIAVKTLTHSHIKFRDRIENESFVFKGQKFPANAAVMSYRVSKSLHPNVYRNVEYDLWISMRREIVTKSWYDGTDNLKVGTKCLFKMGNCEVECYIQRFMENNEKCLVYVEERAQKIVVAYGDLKPLPCAQPWPVKNRKTQRNSIYEYDRRLNNNEPTVEPEKVTIPQPTVNLQLMPIQHWVPIGHFIEIPTKSYSPSGSDLPWNDVKKLQFFYNLGIEFALGNPLFKPLNAIPVDFYYGVNRFGYFQQSEEPRADLIHCIPNQGIIFSPVPLIPHFIYPLPPQPVNPAGLPLPPQPANPTSLPSPPVNPACLALPPPTDDEQN